MEGTHIDGRPCQIMLKPKVFLIVIVCCLDKPAFLSSVRLLYFEHLTVIHT